VGGGKIRTVAIAKSDLLALPEHIETYLDSVLANLPREQHLKDLDRERFIDRLTGLPVVTEQERTLSPRGCGFRPRERRRLGVPVATARRRRSRFWRRAGASRPAGSRPAFRLAPAWGCYGFVTTCSGGSRRPSGARPERTASLLDALKPGGGCRGRTLVVGGEEDTDEFEKSVASLKVCGVTRAVKEFPCCIGKARHERTNDRWRGLVVLA
jgi:hypothetical protein